MPKKSVLYLSILIMVFSFGKQSFSQDVHYTQYSFLPLLQNPSSVGFFDGNMRFSTIYRNQWASVPVNYNSIGFSFDFNFLESKHSGSKFGSGLNFYFDQAGDSKFQTLHLMIPLAYHLYIPISDHTLKISIGGEGGFQYKSLSTSELYYDSQFNGEIYNPDASTNETFENLNIMNPDIGAGINFEFETNTEIKIGLGLALKHINDAKEAYLSNNLKPNLRKRIVIPAHFYIPISDIWDLDVSYLINIQNESQSHLTGLLFGYSIENTPISKKKINMGVFYRVLDAPSIVLQYETNNIKAGLSYDLTASKFSKATNTYGGLELGFTYMIRNVVKPDLKVNKKCFVY